MHLMTPSAKGLHITALMQLSSTVGFIIIILAVAANRITHIPSCTDICKLTIDRGIYDNCEYENIWKSQLNNLYGYLILFHL